MYFSYIYAKNAKMCTRLYLKSLLRLQVEAEQKKGLLSRPKELLLTLSLLGAVAFTVFRGFVSFVK